MKLNRLLFIGSILMALPFAAGCGSTNDSVDDGKAIAAMDINPNKDTLSKGTTFQFHAVVKYGDGSTKDVSEDSDTVWNTSDPSIATVSDGMVTAIKDGVVDISAEYKGQKANEHFVVTP